MSRAFLETLLQSHPRNLARTLVSPDRPTSPRETLSTGVAALDALLEGGWPRGQVSELVGPRSSGRLAVLLAALATTTRRGELAALLDAFDMFDPASGHRAGVVRGRLLWARGSACGVCLRHGRDGVVCAIDRALKATAVVLEAGGFGLVALDFGDAPASALRRWPLTSWLRLARALEGRSTALVIVSATPLWRSAGGLTLALRPAPAAARWAGRSGGARVFCGLEVLATVQYAPGRRISERVVPLTLEMVPDRIED